MPSAIERFCRIRHHAKPKASLKLTQSCPALFDPMNYSMPGFSVLPYLPEDAQTHIHWVSDVIQSSQPLLPLLLLSSIYPTIKVFSNKLVLHIRWPKYWSFSFSISLSNEYSELVSFRIDWFDLLAVQGTLKGFLQHHSLKTSAPSLSAFFMTQLSHPYMTTGKIISLSFGFLSSKWCLCFLIHCLYLTWLFFQEARIF